MLGPPGRGWLSVIQTVVSRRQPKSLAKTGYVAGISIGVVAPFARLSIVWVALLLSLITVFTLFMVGILWVERRAEETKLK